MKTTYLIRITEGSHQGELRIATREEWLNIVQLNKELPVEQQRHFIVDHIVEDGITDRMYIEVDYPVYKEWHKNHQAFLRNQKAKSAYYILSLDETVADKEKMALIDTLSSEDSPEELVYETLFLECVYNEVSEWYPWAKDLLDALLSGNWFHCTHDIAVKFNRTDRAIQMTKKKFMERLKKFMKSFRF